MSAGPNESAADGGGGLAHGRTPPAAEDRFARRLERFSRAVALIGGALLVLVLVLIAVSVIGRWLFDRPILGDYEIAEFGVGVAVFLFFPFTHMMGANIVAEFFTVAFAERARNALDVVHEAVFALVAGVLTWRMTLGGIDKYNNKDSTMLLQIPVWWGFTLAVAAMALLTLVCLVRLTDGMRRLRR